MTRKAQQARAFGWEHAELMLEALRRPTPSDEAEALGRHAAEAIEARALSLAPDLKDDGMRLWSDSASWGFRDRMAIAHELSARGPTALPPRASATDAAWTATEVPDAEPADRPPEPSAAKPVRLKTKAASAKARAKPGVRAAPKKRTKPAPVA